MANIWLKEISMADDFTYCDLLIELANYKEAFARPVPSDFTVEDFESFKSNRIKLAKGENLPSYAIPTSTYWVMEDDVPIGYATLKHYAPVDKPGGHLGCCLKRSAQNRGIGSIVANLLSEIAYNDLGITELVYTSKNENVQSQKSLQKIGANFVKVENGYHYYVVDLNKKLNEGRMR